MLPYRAAWVTLILLTTLLASCDFFDGDPPPEIETNRLPRDVADSLFTTTSSGLKYYDFFPGEGAVADTGAVVSVHYDGWFVDNTLFDSSVLRGVPITFLLGRGQVIKGWDEGIAGMRRGTERQLIIPPGLAYGAVGNGRIPPNATLVFEVIIMDLDINTE